MDHNRQEDTGTENIGSREDGQKRGSWQFADQRHNGRRRTGRVIEKVLTPPEPLGSEASQRVVVAVLA